MLLLLLVKDKMAFGAMITLALIMSFAIWGRSLSAASPEGFSLGLRNVAPFSTAEGGMYVLGADQLGRSELARLAQAAWSTLALAGISVLVAASIGCFIGVLGGYGGAWADGLSMRLADLISGFPSLLLAVVVIYVLQPSIPAVIAVLVVTRMGVYMRVARAEALEIKSRAFVKVATSMGASRSWILRRHILPIIFPTIATVGALEVAAVMLLESSLSFLGLGVQPPNVTWGVMVGSGREYLQEAWWLSAFPGLMILATSVSLTLMSNWLRTTMDPYNPWRSR